MYIVFIFLFLIKTYVNSPRNAGNGIIYAILREKNELPWKVSTFLGFSSFSLKTWKWKEITLKNIFPKEIYIFSLKWLVLHFM